MVTCRLIQSASEVAAIMSPFAAIEDVFVYRAKYSGNGKDLVSLIVLLIENFIENNELIFYNLFYKMYILIYIKEVVHKYRKLQLS